MYRRCRHLALSFTVCLTITGCAAWPEIGSDVAYRDIPTLPEAYDYANSSLGEFSVGVANAGGFERGISYVAYAAAETGAAFAAFNASKDALKIVALTTAGVLGFDTLLNTPAQRKVFAAGYKAVGCAVYSAQARQLQLHHGLLAKIATLQSNLRSQMSMLSVSPLPNADRNSEFVLAVSQRQASLSEFSAAIVRLAAAADTDSESKIAIDLSQAVREIRQAVREQLAEAAPDPGKVVDAQRKIVADQLANRAKDREIVKKNVDKASGSTLELASILENTDSTDPPFKSCVDEATTEAVKSP